MPIGQRHNPGIQATTTHKIPFRATYQGIVTGDGTVQTQFGVNPGDGSNIDARVFSIVPILGGDHKMAICKDGDSEVAHRVSCAAAPQSADQTQVRTPVEMHCPNIVGAKTIRSVNHHHISIGKKMDDFPKAIPAARWGRDCELLAHGAPERPCGQSQGDNNSRYGKASHKHPMAEIQV